MAQREDKPTSGLRFEPAPSKAWSSRASAELIIIPIPTTESLEYWTAASLYKIDRRIRAFRTGQYWLTTDFALASNEDRAKYFKQAAERLNVR